MESERHALYLAVILLCVACPMRSAPLPTTVPEDPVNNYSLLPLQNNKGEEGDFFEGDVRLSPGEDPYDILRKNRRQRTVLNGEDGSGDLSLSDFHSARLWPDNRIPFKYELNLILSIRDKFKQAMEEWEEWTCLAFMPATANDTDYLLLTDRQGCSSYVGRKGGPQEVSINSKCDNKGHAMHEIGHALGLWHEHSRPDRDNYIRIIWDNIKEEKLMNFGILSSDEFSTPSVEYDLESIMHYGPYAFSTDRGRLQTIHILPQVNLSDCAMDMGQRRDLSYLDKVRANVLYSCANATVSRPSCPPPTPTPTPTPTPPPKKVKTIASGTPITIQFEETSNGTIETLALSCDSEALGCRKKHCFQFWSPEDPTCDVDQHFLINLTEVRKNPNIKNGDTVVLRSVLKPTKWLDCNTGQCTITECLSNESEPGNSSYTSDCSTHFFKIYKKNNNSRTAIRITDQVVFKHPNNTLYLNCLNKRCEMRDDPECFTRTSNPVDPASNEAALQQCQRFMLDKSAE